PAAGPVATRGMYGTRLERSRGHPVLAALLAWPGGRAFLCVYERGEYPIQEPPAELRSPQRHRLLPTRARRQSPPRPPVRLLLSFGASRGGDREDSRALPDSRASPPRSEE